MPVQKSPAADLKRRYPLYAEAGLALALGAVILAFTVPSSPPEVAVIGSIDEEPVVLVAIPPTDQVIPPPPPPPAPPPPVEVEDEIEVDDVLAEVDLVLDESLVAPTVAPSPPTPVVIAAPPVDPPTPPAPPVVPIEETLSEEIFTHVQQQPVLIGGLAALQSAVVYPEMARRAEVEGRVIVQFVVDERGTVTEPVVVRSPNSLLSDAALAAVRQIAFEPGQQRGRPVKVRMTVPVTFRLR